MNKRFISLYLALALATTSFGVLSAATVAAAQLPASASNRADAITVVLFDGTTFAPDVVSIANGWEIEVHNGTDQNLSLTVTSGAPALSQGPRVFMPLLSRSDADASAAAPAVSHAPTLDFPARSFVRLTMAGEGSWTVAVAGINNLALAVHVVAMPTPSPTPPPTLPGQQEWKLHKSDDGAHPDGAEQQMVWLMNRARANPGQEGVWLATTDAPDIAPARSFFNVDTNKLQNEFNGYAAKAPAAFDIRLYNAARVHSLDLIARDAQDHDGQFERVEDAGFQCASYRGNVFAYADSAMNAHGGFNIDWGTDADGMQEGRGHRKAIMSLDGDYTNVGLALVAESSESTGVGPLVTTGNYCNAGSGANHYNRFIVGTVWRDQDGDGIYDVGEGTGDVRVMPDRGAFFAVTGSAGGYAIPVTATGDYNVRFEVDGGVTRKVTVDSDSVLLDVVRGAAGTADAAPPEGADAAEAPLPRMPGPPVYVAPEPSAIP